MRTHLPLSLSLSLPFCVFFIVFQFSDFLSLKSEENVAGGKITMYRVAKSMRLLPITVVCCWLVGDDGLVVFTDDDGVADDVGCRWFCSDALNCATVIVFYRGTTVAGGHVVFDLDVVIDLDVIYKCFRYC